MYYRRQIVRNAGRKITPQRISAIKIKARSETLTKWKESIREYERLANTRTLEALQLILFEWMDRRHGHLSFHLTQLLTGHGCFSAFLHRIGKSRSDICQHCNTGRDTAIHTLQECTFWRDQRQVLTGKVAQDLTLPALVRQMLRDEEKLRAVAGFVFEVLHCKEEAEREREGGETPDRPSGWDLK